MAESDIEKCPICGKTVLPLSTLTQHVEECLLLSETKRKTREEDSNLCKGDPAKSFFRSSSKMDSKRTIKSPQIDPKRFASSLEGKSDTSPPDKKPKLDCSKKQVSDFFRPTKGGKQTQQVSSKISEVLNPLGKSEISAEKPCESCLKSDKPITPVPLGLNRAQGKSSKKNEFIPLAEQMRPCGLDDYVGQTKVVGNNCLLRSLLEANEIPSMILWGPPGCGKTSLANIIATSTKKSKNTRFVTLSATTSGINDVKEVIKAAKNEQQMLKRKTILFMDEIHRFNKSQQDTFLSHVENGTITLIGATTENPSFHLNTALLSRCRVFVLEKLSSEALQQILVRAVKKMGVEVLDDNDDREYTTSDSNRSDIAIEKNALIALSNLCDGDARVALNGLQLAVQSRIAASKHVNLTGDQHINGTKSSVSSPVKVNIAHVKEGLQRTHLLYDKKGDEHYNIISALHKSMRGSNENASLYWLARMLSGGEDPLYIARRLVRFASEDVGLADPVALNQAVAAYQACHFIGMPECDVILAQATVYLARAPKSIEIYSAYNQAKQCIKNWEGPQLSVPLHIRNAPTKLLKNLGYGAGYKYNPHYDGPVDQKYLPSELDNINFFGDKI